MGPQLLYFSLFGLGMVLAGAGALLVWQESRRPPLLNDPRCAGCRASLRSFEAPPTRCPGCGADVTSPKRVRYERPPARTWRLVAGGVIVVLALLPVTASERIAGRLAQEARRQASMLAAAPMSELVQEVVRRPTDPMLWMSMTNNTLRGATVAPEDLPQVLAALERVPQEADAAARSRIASAATVLLARPDIRAHVDPEARRRLGAAWGGVASLPAGSMLRPPATELASPQVRFLPLRTEGASMVELSFEDPDLPVPDPPPRVTLVEAGQQGSPEERQGVVVGEVSARRVGSAIVLTGELATPRAEARHFEVLIEPPPGARLPGLWSATRFSAVAVERRDVRSD